MVNWLALTWNCALKKMHDIRQILKSQTLISMFGFDILVFVVGDIFKQVRIVKSMFMEGSSNMGPCF